MSENNQSGDRSFSGPARFSGKDYGMTTVFMDVTDPAIIKDRINDIVERYPNDRDPKAYLALWEWRYEAKGKGNKLFYADRMMNFFNILLHYARTARGYFGKRRAHRDVMKFLRDEKFAGAIAMFNEPRTALYNLFYVAAVRHIRLCMTDRLYTSVAFGMGTLKNSDGAMRMANDTFDTQLFYPCFIGMEEEFPEFIKAVYHAYIDEFPEFHLYINNNIDKSPDPRIRQVIMRIIEQQVQ